MAAAEPGWFGKLACTGDFASRRMDALTRETWDDWISRCLLHTQQQLGTRWLEQYLNAPLWFWLRSPADRRETWTTGTLMPSVDSAGRYYPLVVALPLLAPPLDAMAWSRLEALLRGVADACLATLSDGHAGLEHFDAQLLAAAAAAGSASDESGDAAAAPSHVVTWLLAEFVRQLDSASLWWTAEGQRVHSEARWPQPEASSWLFADGTRVSSPAPRTT
jgi:type VI secretion system protein ImpM